MSITCKNNHKNPDGSKFCEICGEPLDPKKSPTTKLWLWITAAALILIGGCAWLYFSNRPKPAVVVIKVSTYPGKVGIVSGGGEYKLMDTITIKAMANRHGYMFTHWQDGNTDSIRTIVADRDREFVANFKEKPQPRPVPKFEITVESSNSEWGVVLGGNGTYDSLAVVTLEAIANDGFQFVSWDDGNIQPTRTIKATANQSFVASFKKKPSITPSSKPEPRVINVDWNGVATYTGPGLAGQPNGIGGKLVFYRDYQLDLKKIDGKKFEIKAGEVVEGTKFKEGKLIIGVGTLRRKDGTTQPIM